MKKKYKKYTSVYMLYLTIKHKRKWFSGGLREELCFGYWKRDKNE